MGIDANQPISKSRAWLGMMRISNTPTIVSNILVGAALALQVKNETCLTGLNWLLASCVLLIYFAGMILNDAFDANHDKVARPDRPIPSGIIQRKFAWIAGLSMLGIVFFAATLQPVQEGTLLLVSAVLAYTFLHRWFIPAVVLMASCRGLVYFAVASSFVSSSSIPQLIPFSIALAFYTAVLTFIGRFENEIKTKFSFSAWLLLIPPAFIAITNLDTFGVAWFPFAGMVFWIWLAWKNFNTNNQIAGMHKLLSGFCLLDCVLATLIDQYVLGGICAFCFFITIALHRKITGT